MPVPEEFVEKQTKDSDLSVCIFLEEKRGENGDDLVQRFSCAIDIF